MLGRRSRRGITIMRKRKSEGQAIRDLRIGGGRRRRVKLVVIINLLVANL